FVVTTMSRSVASETVATAVGTLATGCAGVAAPGAAGAADGAADAATANGDVETGALATRFGGAGSNARYAVRTWNDRTTARRTRFSMNGQFRRGGKGSKPDEPSGWQRASR